MLHCTYVNRVSRSPDIVRKKESPESPENVSPVEERQVSSVQ